jgi:membrane-associated phospholipid phosphatase
MKELHRIYLSLLLCLLMLQPFTGNSQQADTITHHAVWYRSTTFRTLAAPTVFIGYGLTSFGPHGLYSSWQAKHDVLHAFPGFHTHIDDAMPFVPGAAFYVLHFSGISSRHDLLNATILYGLSSGVTEAVVYSIKFPSHELRPDQSNYLSFPSAHTAFAFAAAEFLHQEYKDQSPWISISGYTVAAATGAMRMMNNKHWLCDVCVGAGVGMLSTKAIYLAYPWLQKKFCRHRHHIDMNAY